MKRPFQPSLLLSILLVLATGACAAQGPAAFATPMETGQPLAFQQPYPFDTPTFTPVTPQPYPIATDTPIPPGASPTATRTPGTVTPTIPLSPTAPGTPLQTPTLGLSPTPATSTPTPSPTPGPSPTPTPRLFVETGTPIPLPLATLSVQNAGSASAIAQFQEDSVTDLAFTPDGQTLAVATFERISLYDLENLDRFRVLFPRTEQVISIAFSPDSRWLVAGSRLGSPEMGWAGALELWSGDLLRPLGLIYTSERPVSSVNFSPNGRTLTSIFGAPAYQEDSIDFFDVATWEITRTLSVREAEILVYSPDGGRFATSPDRYAIKVWDSRNAGLLYDIPTSFTGAVNSMAFSPDGAFLASGHYDGSIRLWNAVNGELVRQFETDGVVESLAWSPNSRLLATGESYANHLVRLWEVDTGQLLRTLEGHESGVVAMKFSPDGQLLVSASYNGAVYVWGLRP